MDQRRQASFVTGWGVSSTSEHYGPLSGIHRIGGPTLIHYKILNDSDGPVSDVVILIPPEQENSPRGNLSIGFLPPKSDRSTEQRSTETLDIEFSVPRAVPFFFTDTQGIRWFRDGQGGLFEWSDEIDARLSGPLAIVAAREARRGLPGSDPGTTGG